MLIGPVPFLSQPMLVPVIDTCSASGIIPAALMAEQLTNNQLLSLWLRSSTAEQLPLKQLVEGSNPPGVTKSRV